MGSESDHDEPDADSGCASENALVFFRKVEIYQGDDDTDEDDNTERIEEVNESRPDLPK